MKVKYHIHLNGPKIGSLDKIIKMIAQNNAEVKECSLEDFLHICKADKIMYPSLYESIEYDILEDSEELVCFNPDVIGQIYWTIIACDVYELSEDQSDSFDATQN